MLLALLPLVAVAQAQYGGAVVNGIDPRKVYEEMEHIMVDNRGFNSDGFLGGVTPCSTSGPGGGGGRPGANGTVTGGNGEQASAEWVRTVFHDFVTADLSAGTGGLDASIGFESTRAENAGVFINATLAFFGPTVSAYLSLADNIAMGLVASLEQCNGSAGTVLPLKAGRIDALEAGPFGVPAPDTDLQTTLAQFAAAGFSQEDTIIATACGHSLGRVHYSNFPNIVDVSYVTVNNTDGGQPFDATPAVFDNAVVTEYLAGEGALGGPLVTALNNTLNSDLRLYISDNNATMETLTDEDHFQAQCNSIFARMIDTVPSNVQLTEPIVPMTWKAVHLQQDISVDGVVTLAGFIRNLLPTLSTFPTEVSFTAGSASGVTNGTAGTGTSVYGQTVYYPFNTTIDSSATSLDFETASYPLTTSAFVLPLASVLVTGGGGPGGGGRNQTRPTPSIQISGAILSSIAGAENATATMWVSNALPGTVGVDIVQQQLNMVPYAIAGDYTLFTTGTMNMTGRNIGNIIAKVGLGNVESDTIQASLFA